MKSEWQVTANPVGGKMLYGVVRIRDTSKVDHSGNREYHKCGYMKSKDEAEELVRKLNEEERNG